MPGASTKPEKPEVRLSTGIPGLDEVLHGGLVPRRTYLVRGGPGTGKSTLALHFLVEGSSRGEKVLLISMGEAEAQIRHNGTSLGLDLEGVRVLDLSPSAEAFAGGQVYDIFSPAEVERGPLVRKIMEEMESVGPTRVVVDSLTQFRYLVADPFQFRKQALSIGRYLTEKGATVVLSSEGSPDAPDDDLQFLCDGVINLEAGPEGRVLSVSKFRGSGFQSGPHSVRLTDKGVVVSPRLVPDEQGHGVADETLPFGLAKLDELLHGGLERGGVTIISGPSGAGKTSLGLQFIAQAASKGERSVLYSFEEGQETMLRRCDGIQMPIRNLVRKGALSVVPVDPLLITADEFAQIVRRDVEGHQASVVMIDSISGYRLCLGSRDLIGYLHALCRYLRNRGVTTILVNKVESITGEFRATELGISHLVDNILFMRYIEAEGELRRTMGVLKKRTSDFEKTLVDYDITSHGIRVGEKLTLVGGILGGVEHVRRILAPSIDAFVPTTPRSHRKR